MCPETNSPPGRPAIRRDPVVAVVGATGAVGREFLACLETRRFPLRGLRLFASARSAGVRLMFKGEALPVEELTDESLDGIDIALFSAGSTAAKVFAPGAARRGTVVIDNSSAFRMAADVPLVVPEINAAAIAGHRGIIANPNCVAIISNMALWPIHRRNRIRRIFAATYQSASGAGAAAMAELTEATRAYLDGRQHRPSVLRHPYAFNLFSHDSAVDPASGYNGEEIKVMQETRKIFADPEIRIGITCVRVPVLRAHSMALTVECERPIDPEAARAMLREAPGVRLVDDVANNRFPMPRDAADQGEVLVGRIRRDLGDPDGRSLSLFAAGDQLLKGAALNAVQIAEHLPAAGFALPQAALPG
ncbi:MAG TPA: aspartate-semialdehyde dehydrogenase [Candidatus Sulfotelmatobacter sp.]|nr:aspartate-semialdehyde dehydrogenase [Candidatus Sulfotelmatobacter sp.]